MRSMLLPPSCLVLMLLACGGANNAEPVGGLPAGAGAGGASSANGGGGSGEAGGGSGEAGGGGVAAAPAIRFIGRTDDSATGVTRFAWSGSGVAFRFSGTEASVRMDDAGRFFTVLVDGSLQPALATQPGERSYPVASGLTEGEHEVLMYRRTEASFGNTSFVDLELGSGTLLPPPPARTRRVELIGDSITCGYGNLGADQNCNFSADTEDHYQTYGAIAARNVNAELTTVAWSGKGVVFNFGDDKNEPLPALYDRTLPSEPQLLWDFSWQPDAVVINLGTNDFSTDDDPSETVFTAAYEAFLIRLRDKYPNAYILCLIPTLLSGSDLTTAQSYIESVVAARNTAGDNNVEAHAMSFQRSGWGCDWHPSLATHASMGEALTQKLKSSLSW